METVPAAPAAPPPRRRFRIFSRRGAIRLACLFGVLILLGFGCWSCMIRMPGSSYDGPLPPLSSGESAISASLRRDVEELAGRIGIRNPKRHANLERAADYVESRFREAGYAAARQTFEAYGKAYHNLEVERPGKTRAGEIVVVGAHYDSGAGAPGANDNASGTAALLALAAAFAKDEPARTLRFVAFTTEEPPYYRTENMGSRRYARRCRERNENIVAMLSLETMGYYSDREGTQAYPAPLSLFYPSKGDFIAFAGNVASRGLVRELVGSFRAEAKFPSEGAALPGWLDGVGWSDHESFWREGYEAVMVTDTAVFRYPEYHTPRDTPDQVDSDRCARVVAGLERVIRKLVTGP